ncbi:pectate lyase domain-containing protein [Ditylenchus destructor]|nr:pectate lyase domain-containing protein [Ditylenchus destructor]
MSGSNSRRSSDATDYVAKTKEIEEKLTNARKMSQEFAKKVADDDDLKEDRQYDLDVLESEIKKRRHELANYREKACKKREKESQKVKKMVDRAIIEQKKLEYEDNYESGTERTLVDELEALKFEAKRLADEIALEQKQNAEYAEITEHELIKAEEEATHEALELSQHQKEDWYDIENHLRDLTINKDLAIRKVKSLAGKFKMIQEDLDEKRDKLQDYRKDAISAEEAFQKMRSEIEMDENELRTLTQNDDDAHVWLENLRRKEARIRLLQEGDEEIDQEITSAINIINDIANKKLALENKLRKLRQREADASKWAEFQQSKVLREIIVIHTNEQMLSETEAELDQAQDELQLLSEEKKRAKVDAVEFRDKATEATAKAEKLAGMITKERREAQATLQNIVGEEREAIQEAYQLGKGLKPHNNQTFEAWPNLALVRYVPEFGDGSQSETQPPIFELEDGATVKNVILGAPSADGIHCKGSCIIENCWWEDVGEEAATFRGGASATYTVTGGGAKKAADKVFQHDGGGTLTIQNFQVEDFGKLYRSCGNFQHDGGGTLTIQNSQVSIF